ncbi:DNA-binding protein [Roseibium aquae]|uniref:DNA-binding protein n=1 Tax=Roseibium aquae TaxID=1323746 RepID=A0A916T9A3_9HYPH|nr:helix-turn-helix transcriptional regulator [Roseibium aquae]GGB36482.1 DNA-binding protein [Roseibium aquae]
MLEDLPVYLTTRELADLIRVKERKVYDLVATGGVPHSRATGKLLFPRDAVLAWIEEAGDAIPGESRPLVALGSHDPLLEWTLRSSECGLASLFDGSLDGLDRFGRREGVLTGLHVPDEHGDGWNTGIAERLYKYKPVVLIEWAKRQRGLIVAPGNPKRIRGLADLAGKRLVQRQEAAGSHLFLQRMLATAGAGVEAAIQPGPRVRDEREAALAVFSGEADAAFGLETAARQNRLEFIPLRQERFDLLIGRKEYFEAPVQSLLRFTKTAPFAEKATQFGGYDISGLGTVHFNGA